MSARPLRLHASDSRGLRRFLLQITIIWVGNPGLDSGLLSCWNPKKNQSRPRSHRIPPIHVTPIHEFIQYISPGFPSRGILKKQNEYHKMSFELVVTIHIYEAGGHQKTINWGCSPPVARWILLTAEHAESDLSRPGEFTVRRSIVMRENPAHELIWS
jgi:hypothetical protein